MAYKKQQYACKVMAGHRFNQLLPILLTHIYATGLKWVESMRSFRTYCHVGYLSFELLPCIKKGVATIISFRLVTVIGSGYIANLDKIGPIKVIIVP